jgi:hypothetical protein
MRSSSVPISTARLGCTLNSAHASWEAILLPHYSPRSSLAQLSLNARLRLRAAAFFTLHLRILPKPTLVYEILELAQPHTWRMILSVSHLWTASDQDD